MDELQRVLLRLSQTEDEQLGAILDKLLPRLLKLLRTSTSNGKLVEIINLALTRCKAYNVPLPLIPLAEEFLKDNDQPSSAETLFRHLTMLFLDLGASQASKDLQERYSDFLLKSRAFSHADTKFAVSFFLQSLHGLQPSEHLTDAWAQLCEEFLFIPAGSENAPVIPGLSSDMWSIWKPKVAKFDKNRMIALKRTILDSCALAPTSLAYSLFLTATVDAYDTVNELGQTLIARREGSLEVDSAFLRNLVRLARRHNAPSKIRVKVLQLLARHPLLGLEVIESLDFVQANLKGTESVQTAALAYVRSLSDCTDQVPPNALLCLLHALEANFWANGVLDLNGEAPQALKLYGALSKRQPPKYALTAAPTLFSLLTQYPDEAASILEALGGLLHSLSAAEDHKATVAQLVSPWMSSPQPILRREALRWTLHLLRPEDPQYHLSALRHVQDVDSEVRAMCEKALERRQMPSLDAFMDALVERNIVTAAGKLVSDASTEAGFLSGLTSYLTSRGIQPDEYMLENSNGPHARFVRALFALGDYFVSQNDVKHAMNAYGFLTSVVPCGTQLWGTDMWGQRFELIRRGVVTYASFPMAHLLQKINLISPNADAFQHAVHEKHILVMGALCTRETEHVVRPLLQDALVHNRANAVQILEALRLLKAFSSVAVDVDDSLLQLSAEFCSKDNERAFAAVQLLSKNKVLEVATMEHWKDREDAQCAIALALDPVDMLREPLQESMWAPVWASSFLKRLAERTDVERIRDGSTLSADVVESLARLFARGISGMSLFVADCSTKGLVRLWMLQPPERRDIVVKSLVSWTSQRTQVDSMFVGRGNEKESKDSLQVAAKERIEGMKELIFLARELGHFPLLIGLLDQPTASSSSGVCQEAVDVQSLCIPSKMRDEVCPAKLLPKLPPYFFHPVDALRSKVIALCLNYFGIEQALHCGAWDAVYPTLVETLGAARASTREASILCATQLLRGRSWEELKEHMDPLWFIGVKLMDDLEKRVQAVIGPFVRVLRALTIRVCDCTPGSGTTPSDATDAIKIVLPLLLKFADIYDHAQPLCFDVLREISKAARTDVLAPFLRDLVPMLLTSLSAMEHGGLQYYQLHANKLSEGDQFEKARVNLSHASPSHDLLRRLVRFIDAASFADLHAPLLRLLRHGVGANTRCGVCDWYEWMSSEKPHAFGTFGAAVLKGLAGALFDTSGIVRGKAASAFASLARRLEDSKALQKVIDEKLLQDDNSTSFREASAKALSDIGRRCDVRSMNLDKDVLGKLAARAFVLKNNEDERVKKMWLDVWSEYSLPLSANATYIMNALINMLNSQDRNDRIGAAKGAVELVNGLQTHGGHDELATLSTALQGSLANWKGIGHVVKAVAEVALKVLALTGARKQAVSALEQCRTYSMKGDREDRQHACQSLLMMIQKGNLHAEIGYEGAHEIYTTNCEYVNAQEKEIEIERVEQLVDPHLPKIRGRSNGDDFFISIFDVYSEIFEAAKETQNDEDDIEPPDNDALGQYLRAWLSEFLSGALALRLALLRALGRIFRHLKKIKVTPTLNQEVMDQIVGSWADDRMRIRVASFETLAAVWDAGWALDDTKLKTLVRDLGEDVKSEIDIRQLETFIHHLREVEG